jgi:RNA polymerase sigma-70 factor, ECF subfamily
MLTLAAGTSLQTDSSETRPQVDEAELVEALRGGDETAFVALLEQYHSSLVRLAMLYVPSRAVAEDVAQETWLGLLRGIDRFEARSSLKTWLFRILVNRAKTRGEREGRLIPFSALWSAESDPYEAAVEPERFLPADHPQWPGHWASPPNSWGESPEERLLAGETRAHIDAAIRTLPPAQQEVITLRDVEGWGSAEVCDLLGISEANQRVLLHRARSKVRRALEAYLGSGEGRS